MMLVHVIMPKAEEVAAPAEAAAAAPTAPAEPEVIKKGKKEEEDERRTTRRRKPRRSSEGHRRARESRREVSRARGTTSGSRCSTSWRGARASQFDAAPVEALIARWRGRDTLLAKPMTFMNASGEAVGGLLRYFKIEPRDLLVVVDEVQLPLAKLRARARGSAGGHNGLKSIIAHLGDEFARLRIGVGRGDAAARPRGPCAREVRQGRSRRRSSA